jgi:hypothetical protein
MPELWVLRSTLTLKTTDTTLVSVDGGNGQLERGALVHLPYASPELETITEVTPSATVTPTQSLGCGEAAGPLDLGRDRAQDQVLPLAVAQE